MTNRFLPLGRAKRYTTERGMRVTTCMTVELVGLRPTVVENVTLEVPPVRNLTEPSRASLTA